MRERYDIILALVMLLMTGCSAEDAVMETMTAPEDGVAISFCCNYNDNETPITRAGYEGTMNTEDLRTTGFGAMASVTAGSEAPYDNVPNLMYNQEVEYTLVGDLINPKKGIWSYSPTKYWPNNLEHCYISAYAPYVAPSDLEGLPADETGIYGISANNVAPYIDYRRCEKPGEQVDLLWYYEEPTAIPAATALNEAGTLAMKMRHALARLELKAALAADPGTTKVLIEEIILTGKMAKTGRLSLCSQTTEGSGVDTKYYPVWTNQVFDKNIGGDDIDHTFQIKNVDNDPESYGIIESQVRYIPNLPYSWQPEGLSTTPQDALNTGDRKGYVYLIPQDELTLTITVKYKKWVEGADEPTSGAKTTTVTPTSIANPLRGNKTYTLNLTLSGI